MASTEGTIRLAALDARRNLILTESLRFEGCTALSLPSVPAIIPSSINLGSEDGHANSRHSKGKFYLIECPEGTTVVRCLAPFVRDGADSHDLVVVPFRGETIKIPADPPELLPLLAESGRCGLSLVSEPVPDEHLACTVSPNCDENDVRWMSVDYGSRIARCYFRGFDFGLKIKPDFPKKHVNRRLESSHMRGSKRICSGKVPRWHSSGVSQSQGRMSGKNVYARPRRSRRKVAHREPRDLAQV